MAVARIDLADAASPERLVIEILKHEPNLPIPVPIEQLCAQLDIIEIKPLTTSGFEGGLITDSNKHSGIILYNQASPKKRRRFTISHELAHFLIPSHVPDAQGKFLCSQQDMFLLSATERDRRSRMEVDANRFASLILLPPPAFRLDATQHKDADIRRIIALSDKYQVSFEAVGRAYVNFRREPVAVIIAQHGRVLRYYRDNKRFPFINVQCNSPVPHFSLLLRKKHEQHVPSEIDETDAGVWLDIERGRQAPTLWEQVYVQSQGYAVVMLSLEQVEGDETDRDAERTAKQRYQERQARRYE